MASFTRTLRKILALVYDSGIENKFGVTPLVLSVKSFKVTDSTRLTEARLKILKMLIRYGADVNEQDEVLLCWLLSVTSTIASNDTFS